MAINYDEVIAELRATESSLKEELKQVSEAIPAMIILRNRDRMERQTAVEKIPQMTIAGIGKYARMGPTQAIPEVMRDVRTPLTTREIFNKLSAGGWTSGAQKPVGVVSATMISLEEKGIAERVGDGWRLKASSESPSWNPNGHSQPLQQ